MKTKEQQIKAKLNTFRNTLKLRIMPHREQPNAVNSYMIASGSSFDYTGFIVGGIRTYIPADEMTKLCYPSVFKSRASAQRHIDIDIWSQIAIDSRADAYELELRAA